MSITVKGAFNIAMRAYCKGLAEAKESAADRAEACRDFCRSPEWNNAVNAVTTAILGTESTP